MADKLTEAQLASLTDEEREGLLEEDEEGDGDDDGDLDGDGDAGGGDDSAASTKGADSSGDDKVNLANIGDGDPAAQATTAGDASTAAQPSQQAATQADATNAATAEADQEPTPTWVLPGDFDDRLKAVKDEKAALTAKFDDGELTGGEYQQQLQAIDDRHDLLREQKIEANIALNSAKRDYGAAVNAFLGENPQYEKGSTLFGLLDAELRKLQSTAANPLSPKLIEQAHAKVNADLRKALGITEQPAGKTVSKAGAGQRPAPPPTLRDMPATDIEDTSDGGEFAALDRLSEKDSVAYERELSTLRKRNPDAYDRYMAM